MADYHRARRGVCGTDCGDTAGACGHGRVGRAYESATAVTLAVGVLTFNSEHALPDLLASLPDGLAGVDGWKLIVADSGSTDATLEVVGRLAQHAEVIKLGTNRGFAASANAVIEANPTTEAVLLLSPTTRLHPGSVRAMLDRLRVTGAGVVVPRLVGHGGLPAMSLRRRPTAGRAWAEAILGGTIARRIATWSVLIADPAKYHAGTKADWATGAATMVGRECLDTVGGLDESFFLYSEETEFELRAADHGFRLALAPDATVVHLGGASRARPELWALTCANSVRLHGMRSRRPAAWSFWAAVLTGELLRVSVSRPATRRAAIGKLLRERSALISGRPAKHPYPAD